MIELLLQADQALAIGFLDQAERLYRQAVDADPRNAIAVVGLARVALERGDERTAHAVAAAALRLDPENLVAQRIASRSADVLVARGEALPAPAGGFGSGPAPARPSATPGGPEAPGPGAHPSPPASGATASMNRQKPPGLLRRLFGGR